MTLNASEQYLLELMNRARLDPGAEAKRYGIDLNAGLATGQISLAAKQALAPNAMLETAATGHSQWMLAADVFSHTGAGGSSPGGRAKAAGYAWQGIAENIGFSGTTGTINLKAAIDTVNKGLFLSAGHRVNLLNNSYRETGLAAEQGQFRQNGVNYNAVVVTEMFGRSGSSVFLTGVAYTDTNADAFYSMGEGSSGVSFKIGTTTALTTTAGGYALATTMAESVSVTGKVGLLAFAALIDMSDGNVKLDVVNANTLNTSASITLVSGIQNVTLLGVGSIDAIGSASINTMTGGSGNNLLDGKAGNDVIRGAGGNDLLKGDAGNDKLWGDDGNDVLTGDLGADELHGGAGLDALNGGVGFDKIWGDAGNDTLTGGADADSFIFMPGFGADRITDFSLAQKDLLVFDNALWANTTKTEAQVVSQYAKIVDGHVVFDFGGGQTVILNGVASTAGLAALIDFI